MEEVYLQTDIRYYEEVRLHHKDVVYVVRCCCQALQLSSIIFPWLCVTIHWLKRTIRAVSVRMKVSRLVPDDYISC